MREAASGALELEARIADGPDRFAFATADGLCSPDAFRPAELRLADALWDRDLGDLLVPAANYGVVGTLLAGAAASVTMTESSARAADLCERNARRNGGDASVALLRRPASLEEAGAGAESAACAPPFDAAANASPLDVAASAPRFDAVAYAPKPYAPIALGSQRIADAMELLAPGGQCVVAATPTSGLARYRDALEALAGNVETVADRDDVAVIEVTRPASLDPPQFVEHRSLEPTVDGVDLDLVSVPGLFAAGGLDHGTRLLVEALDVARGDRVLDLCCGYGPIGTYAAATADCSVWLSDDDRLATRCAECSLQRTDLAAGSDATVVTGDCTEAVADRRFDLVATNPPTHAGSGVLSDLFAGVHDVLQADGECLFVRHEALDLTEYCRDFETVETVATGADHVVRRVVP